MAISFVSSTVRLTVWPALPEEECKQTGGPTGISIETPKRIKAAPSNSTQALKHARYHLAACNIKAFENKEHLDEMLLSYWDAIQSLFRVQAPFLSFACFSLSLCL